MAHADTLGPLEELPFGLQGGATITSAFWNSLTNS